jgi:hypothetical protein
MGTGMQLSCWASWNVFRIVEESRSDVMADVRARWRASDADLEAGIRREGVMNALGLSFSGVEGAKV